MTIYAINFNRRAGFVIKIAVAMRVLTEVTVDAVHSLFQVNVVEMNRFPKLVRIISCNLVASGDSHAMVGCFAKFSNVIERETYSTPKGNQIAV